MIAVIRIKGQVGLKKEIVETFNRLKLRKKYSCIVIEDVTKEQIGMIEKVRNFVAYGEINDETYKELVEKRGGKIKNFFRLHPPRKGIDSKKHFGVAKGVLGNNKEKINDLIRRML
ncbi:uL30 family ribosomal protein [Candidatus Pacearchaeota archaeon]|nr:uL30 family ribosomal protein [Candidatus Pacearchaeota archaeon]